jgi:hypothetical protein
MHPSIRNDDGVLESGAILMLSAVDWMSTENALAVIDGWLRGSFQKTLLEPGPAAAQL